MAKKTRRAVATRPQGRRPRGSVATRLGSALPARATRASTVPVDVARIFIEILEHLREDRGRLFPAGASELDLNVDLRPDGRSSLSVRVTPAAAPSLEAVAASAETGPLTEAGIQIAPAAVVGPFSIDLAKPLPIRVAGLWNILDAVVSDLDASASPARRRVIKTFFLRLAAHESQLRTRKQDANGPARSLFQFEAHRAKDAGAHAHALGLLGTLAAVAGASIADVTAAIAGLPGFNAANPNTSARFPAGSLIEGRLLDNDLFAAYLLRIDFRRFAAAIPEVVDDQAEYWFRFWKVSAADPAGVKQQFAANAALIEPHIPA